jgi:alpha-glucosidase
MLNYVFTTNNGRRGDSTRPTILHRWGGLGNHKFQLGFSGDVYPSWESLAFQPYFTQTAANVGFMWSHDIGGHNTPVEPELYTRYGSINILYSLWCLMKGVLTEQMGPVGSFLASFPHTLHQATQQRS